MGIVEMTDKEFKKLRRSDLIEIIYEYQKREKNLNDEINELKYRLSQREGSENISAILDAVVDLKETIESGCKSHEKNTGDEYLKDKINKKYGRTTTEKNSGKHKPKKLYKSLRKYFF